MLPGSGIPSRVGALERIIDANFNRSREAVRVLEDLARLALDDEDLASDLKSLRHDLTAAVRSLPIDPGQLLASRDTPGDVGTRLTTDGERSRASLEAVAGAAGARLSEALRSLEEASKALGADAGPIESVRYRSYELDRRLRTMLAGGRARQWTLCVLVTEALCTHRSWESVVEQAAGGGADCFQLREKDLTDRELLARARRLVEIARPFGASVIINDRPDIALLSAADGVHLGQTDLSVRDVRAVAGTKLLVGVSCATLEHARQAARDGADSIGVGPMFPSTTKPKDTLSGPETLIQILADPITARLPHLAISGITPANVAQLAAVGCKGVAVSGAVCSAEEPASVCRSIIDAIDPGRSGRTLAP